MTFTMLKPVRYGVTFVRKAIMCYRLDKGLFGSVRNIWEGTLSTTLSDPKGLNGSGVEPLRAKCGWIVAPSVSLTFSLD